LKQWDKAIADCDKALELERYSLVVNQRNSYYASLNQSDQAHAFHAKIIELNPKNAHPLVQRASYYANLNQWDKAIADCDKAIDLEPKNAGALYQRANAYFQLKRWDKAAADSTRFIDLNPLNAIGWVTRGAALNNLGQYENGVADNSKAIELASSYVLAWNNRAWALERLGAWQKAATDYTKVLELNPGFPLARSSRGRCYAHLGRFTEARTDYEKALPVEFSNGRTMNEFAWLLATCPDAKIRDVARAIKLADEAVKLAPKEGGSWNTLGVAHYRAGNWKAAWAALEKSKELRKGGDAFDWFFTAMAHWKLGDHDAARKWYNQAVAWMDKNQPENEELRRFRAEAEELLKKEPEDSNQQSKEKR
jgi:tetratricopeptide (TPR) repeat protein